MRFFKHILKMFRPTVEVVELQLTETTPTDSEAVASLASHPGFLHLQRKLRLQRRYFERKLCSEVRTDIREVDQLQEAIRWCGWLERQVLAALGQREKIRTRLPSEVEKDAFQEALASFEEIGR